MIILGIGSNLGDRLTTLRLALQHIKQVSGVTVTRVSPVYMSDALLPENAPADWNIPYLNAAIQCESTLESVALLAELKKIEHLLGRKPDHPHWGPRVIDIDILAWDKRVIKNSELTIPHAGLLDRPFALWPLADLAPEWLFPLDGKYHNMPAAQLVEQWGSRFTGNVNFHTRQINQRIDTPQLVGIINITPDSFSDGGLFLQAEKAYEQALQLVRDGATVLDIGAESTRPDAAAIDPATEWSRLEPVITAILAAKKHFLLAPIISIDTRHPATARKAIHLGIDWINDQTGCDHPDMRTLIAESNVNCVIMHHLSIPEKRNHSLPRQQNPVTAVYQWGEKRLLELEQSGIDRQKIIFDPGIGFGKQADQSLQLLRHVDTFAQLGVRLLIGHSRKSFLSLFTSKPAAERDIETAAMTVTLAKSPIDYLRVHQVDANARALRMAMSV
jgi:2-amino-4-hydroxy-6-hydroxymethyldihydropteridine diphosphokinase/dihydropteroate synthase